MAASCRRLGSSRLHPHLRGEALRLRAEALRLLAEAPHLHLRAEALHVLAEALRLPVLAEPLRPHLRAEQVAHGLLLLPGASDRAPRFGGRWRRRGRLGGGHSARRWRRALTASLQ